MIMISKQDVRRLDVFGFATLEYAFYAVLIIRALTAVYILSGNMSDTVEINKFFFLDAFLSSVVKLLDAVLDYLPDSHSQQRPKKSTMHKLKTLFMFVVRRKRK